MQEWFIRRYQSTRQKAIVPDVQNVTRAHLAEQAEAHPFRDDDVDFWDLEVFDPAFDEGGFVRHAICFGDSTRCIDLTRCINGIYWLCAGLTAKMGVRFGQ